MTELDQGCLIPYQAARGWAWREVGGLLPCRTHPNWSTQTAFRGSLKDDLGKSPPHPSFSFSAVGWWGQPKWKLVFTLQLSIRVPLLPSALSSVCRCDRDQPAHQRLVKLLLCCEREAKKSCWLWQISEVQGWHSPFYWRAACVCALLKGLKQRVACFWFWQKLEHALAEL